MAKLFLATVVLVALAELTSLQAQRLMEQAPTGSYGQAAINSASNYVQNLPNQMQSQMGQGMSSLQNQGQQQSGLLSGLLGGSGGSSSGPLATLRQLPARGLQMLNNVLTGVRNMLPLGLGRNANNQSQGNTNNPLGQLSPNQLLQGLPKNPVTDLAQGLLGGGQNGSQGSQLRLPNLNQITNPIMEPLQQGRLPDVNELSKGATNTVRDLTDGLSRIPSNLGNTLGIGAQGGRAQEGLGSLLNLSG